MNDSQMITAITALLLDGWSIRLDADATNPLGPICVTATSVTRGITSVASGATQAEAINLLIRDGGP